MNTSRWNKRRMKSVNNKMNCFFVVWSHLHLSGHEENSLRLRIGESVSVSALKVYYLSSLTRYHSWLDVLPPPAICALVVPQVVCPADTHLPSPQLSHSDSSPSCCLEILMNWLESVIFNANECCQQMLFTQRKCVS